MERTTIMLPPGLKLKAARHANTHGISLGQLIRQALQKAIQEPENGKQEKDTLFTDNEVFHGKVPNDLSQNHDDYLYGDQ